MCISGPGTVHSVVSDRRKGAAASSVSCCSHFHVSGRFGVPSGRGVSGCLLADNVLLSAAKCATPTAAAADKWRRRPHLCPNGVKCGETQEFVSYCFCSVT